MSYFYVWSLTVIRLCSNTPTVPYFWCASLNYLESYRRTLNGGLQGNHMVKFVNRNLKLRKNGPITNYNRDMAYSFFFGALASFVASVPEQNRETHCRELLSTFVYGISNNTIFRKLLIFEALSIEKIFYYHLIIHIHDEPIRLGSTQPGSTRHNPTMTFLTA